MVLSTQNKIQIISMLLLFFSGCNGSEQDRPDVNDKHPKLKLP
jgi:hypothetical protein